MDTEPTTFPIPEKYRESYPLSSLIFRAIFGLGEGVLAVYIIYGLFDVLSYFYASYLALAVTVILPLARCTRCHYYGKICHICWGKVTSLLLPKGQEELFRENFKYSVFLYPVWMLPLLVGLVQLARLRNLTALAIFVGYLVVLFISRRLLQWHWGCKQCRQRLFCPGASSFRRKREYLATEVAAEGSAGESIPA